MNDIGIIGASGFFGHTLSNVFKKSNFNTREITRENYNQNKLEKFDILINTATPSQKFWASKNPYQDFHETVTLTADIVYNWNYDKLIQISSISSENYLNHHPYGVNKKAAEVISTYKNSLIVRLGTLYGPGLKKGSLYDLLNSKPLFVNIKSEYDFISTEFVSEWILKNLDKTGIVELGACDTISLERIATELNYNPTSSDRLEKIFSSRIITGMPSAGLVLDFAKNYVNL